MKITYLFHSGFAIETDTFSMIIDYYSPSKQPQQNALDQFIEKNILSRNVPLYVLSSHHHTDHFDPKILEFEKYTQNNPIYIFSQDIALFAESKKVSPIFLEKNQTFENEQLFIKTFGSTDEGVSFYIKIGDIQLFHAGDLNNWHWNEEVPLEESWEYENAYQTELQQIASQISSLDVAMLPLDPRLGNDFGKGAEQFLEGIPTRIFLPMHFGSKYTSIASFEPIAKKKGSNMICWTRKKQTIEF